VAYPSRSKNELTTDRQKEWNVFVSTTTEGELLDFVKTLSLISFAAAEENVSARTEPGIP
jgi:hypothetical protein